MKKAIKDLTEKDVKSICNNQSRCANCPLFDLPLYQSDSQCYETIQILKKDSKLLDKKVKVK